MGKFTKAKLEFGKIQKKRFRQKYWIAALAVIDYTCILKGTSEKHYDKVNHN